MRCPNCDAKPIATITAEKHPDVKPLPGFRIELGESEMTCRLACVKCGWTSVEWEIDEARIVYKEAAKCSES